MNVQFARGQWNMDQLTYAYSYRFRETPTFIQANDCIENRKNPDSTQGYDNITLLTKDALTAGTRISTRCSFDHYGAPLITIADKLHTDENGIKRFGNYFEVVIYESGINVWQMYYRDGTVTWDCLMRVEFPVSAMEIHTLTVEVQEQKLLIEADDHKMMLHAKDLYPSFHIGINACEGVNHFYSMSIEPVKR